MIKVPRSQSCYIKDMIYPETKKTNKNFHIGNMKALKQKQLENKVKKEEKENYVQAQPFKIKEFRQVESKIGKMMTNKEETIKNYASERKTNVVLNKAALTNKQSSQNKMYEKTKSVSLFKNKNEQKTNPVKLTANKFKKEESDDEENIYNVRNIEDEIAQFNEGSDNEVKNKIYVDNADEKRFKGPTKSSEINTMTTRKDKNHILENKNMQNNHPTKDLNKLNKKEELEVHAPTHKNFGKTPEYLKKYKQEAEMKKENERRLAEEAKYPKGTKLLSEDERVQTLNQLLESRKEIVTLLEKFPISMRTMSIQNRKTELENKLNEIENAIKLFSRKQVYIKSDN